MVTLLMGYGIIDVTFMALFVAVYWKFRIKEPCSVNTPPPRDFQRIMT